MEVITNDMDRICNRDYVVGLGWALLSVAGAFVSFFFERLGVSIYISHAPGFGIGQAIIGFICIISLLCSLGYVYQTYVYQKFLGK